MTGAALHGAALWGAFWVVVLSLRRKARGPEDAARFVFGLALAALSAHLGWALLHVHGVLAAPGLLAAPAGLCALFAPFGVLAAAPWRSGAARWSAYLEAMLGPLPLALAVARVGCLAAGCCRGLALTLAPGAVSLLEASPLGDATTHPVPIYDAAGLLLLHALVRRLPGPTVPGAVLVGLGVNRLANEPVRATPPLGEPLVPIEAIAFASIAAGSALWIARQRAWRCAVSSAPLESRERASAGTDIAQRNR